LLLINKPGINPKWLEKEELPIFLDKLINYPFDKRGISTKGSENNLSPLRETQSGGIMQTDISWSGLQGVPLLFEGSREFENGIVIPLLEDQPVSAGLGASLDNEDHPTRYIRAPHYLAKYPHLASLPVRGDSMEPTLHDGDLVVCDGGGWDGDGIYVIKTAEKIFVKRVLFTPQGYQVVSDNKLYPSYTGGEEEMSILGKVRCAVIMVPGKRGGI
jgi:SOS-response transcriptional repressor LexA